MRKRVGSDAASASARREAEKDVPALATVLVTSEDADHPIDHAFDAHRGPAGTRWIAAAPGDQVVTLQFDAPQTIDKVIVEVEEPAASRTQEIQLAVSRDGGTSYRELLRQEYTFSPPGTTFEHEEWTVSCESVTHLRLTIRPDKSGRPFRATLTALVLE